MTKLPYETATSGQRAIAEIQKTLHAFGCGKFGHMNDCNAIWKIANGIKWKSVV